MAQARTDGAVPTPSSQVTVPAVPSKLGPQIDLLVSLQLWAWPALTLAIQNGWGGGTQTSSDKRDWMVGAVSELLTSTPPQVSDVEDLEEVLIQVMLDEFEVVVDDGTAAETATKIWKGVQKLRTGDTSEIEELYTRWEEKQKKGGEKVNAVRGEDKDGEDTDWDDTEDEDEEWNGFQDGSDVQMQDAESPVEAKSKQKFEPEIDEDGFTKVVSKKKR